MNSGDSTALTRIIGNAITAAKVKGAVAKSLPKIGNETLGSCLKPSTASSCECRSGSQLAHHAAASS